MKYRIFLVTLLMTTPAFSWLRAQQSDAPPVNANSVLATLSQIKQKQHTDITSAEGTLAQTLMTAASSVNDALAYYINAVYVTQFNGMNHEAKEFQDWKKRHEPDFKDTIFRDALCLHLMYLSLTVSHDSGVKVKDLIPSLLTYVQQVEASESQLEGQEEFMTLPLTKSIFVRSLQIDQYVTDDATWELIPIKVDGIYSKVILPEYRRTRNAAAIFQYWDERIQREETDADNSKRPLDIDNFAKTTKPSLLWQRSEEYVGLGQKNNAINNMLAIIQANPYHANAPAWIEELEKLVKASAPMPPPAAAQAGTPAPAAAQADATSTAPAAPPVANSPDTTAPPAQN